MRISFFTLLIALLIFVGALRDLLPKQFYGFPVRASVELFWQQLALPMVNFIDRHLLLLASWPVAIVLASYLLLNSKAVETLASSILRRTSSFAGFGFSVKLGEQIEALGRENDDLKSMIPSVQKNVAEALRREVADMGINVAFSQLTKEICEEIKRINPEFEMECCRATIHVEGLVFSGQLLQLTEYFSGSGTVYPGETAGRTFSIRRGIVGRVWRSNLAEIQGVLPTAIESAKMDEDEKDRHIAQIWGFTIEEAKHAKKYPSYIGVPVKYRNRKTAVFYMDSTLNNAFSEAKEDSEALSKFIQVKFAKSGIGSALGDIDRKLGTNIKIDALESFDG